MEQQATLYLLGSDQAKQGRYVSTPPPPQTKIPRLKAFRDLWKKLEQENLLPTKEMNEEEKLTKIKKIASLNEPLFQEKAVRVDTDKYFIPNPISYELIPKIILEAINILQNSEARYEVAEMLAQRTNGGDLLTAIKSLSIKDPSQRSHLALLIANHKGDIPKNIKDFEINDQDKLFEIACACARQNPLSLITNFKNFEITDQNKRIEIAMLLCTEVKYDITQPFLLPKFIENFKITDQDSLFQIAMNCTKYPFSDLSKHIVKFNLKDEKRRFEIAMELTKNESEVDGIGKYFLYYGITNPELKTRLAEKVLLSHEDITEASYRLPNFKLDDDIFLKFVKIAALRGASISENMRDDQYITINQSDQEEIAKIEISHPMFIGGLSEIVESLDHYNISYDVKEEIILKEILKKNITFVDLGGKLIPTKWINLLKKLSLIEINDADEPKIAQEELIKFIQNFKDVIKSESSNIKNPLISQPYIDFIDSIKIDDTFKKKVILFNFISAIGLCELNNVSQEEVNFLIPIFRELLNLPDPLLRGKISELLVNNSLGPKGDSIRKLQQELVDEESKEEKQLIAFLLSLIDSNEKNKEKIHNFIKIIYSNKNLPGNALTIIRELLYNLHQVGWDNADKISLLEKLFRDLNLKQQLNQTDKRINSKEKKRQKEEFNSNYRKMLHYAEITSSLLFLDPEELKHISSQEEIKDIIIKKYEQMLGKTGNQDELINKFQNTFDKFRDKYAIFNYYARLRTLAYYGDRVKPWFEMYVQSVLDGTFKEIRYQETPHLAAIYKARPDLKDLWPKEDVTASDELLKTSKVDPSNKREDISRELFPKFHNAIISQKHLGENAEENYSFLFQFLNKTQSGKDVLVDIETQRNKLLNENKEKGANKKENNRELSYLNFQKAVINIFNPVVTVDIALREALRICPESTFKADLQGELNLMAGPDNTHNKYKVLNTDDPCDFLLMGTEVESSCQKISGDPKLNRGLLGSMLNGQNRLILVKNKDNKIVGRVKLRLLLDEKENKPLLYFEIPYFSLRDPKVNKLLKKMAIRTAKRLNLTLVTALEGNKKSKNVYYPNSISAKESLCPEEYIDALKLGEVCSSAFTIPRSRVMYSPKHL